MFCPRQHNWLAVCVFSIISILLMSSGFNPVLAQNCTVNAGVDDSICPNQVLQLHGSSAGLYTGLGNIHWTQRSGPSVNITDPYDLNTTVTGFTGGETYSFYLWAKCLDGSLVRDSVSYKIFTMSTAQAGPDQTSCAGSGVISMSANTPGSGETGFWTIVGANNAGVTIVNTGSPTTALNLSGTACGTTTLRWTIQTVKNCYSYDDVVITNYGGQSPVSAGPDQNLSGCYSTTTSTNLQGSGGGCGLGGQQGTWTQVSGPNIPAMANNHAFNTQVSGLIEGTYTFRWDVVGPCASGTDLVNIVVPHALGGVTGAGAGTDQVFCDGRTSFTLTGNVPLNANETGVWTGPVGFTITSPGSPITPVTAPPGANGSYGFTWTVTNTLTGCTSSDGTNITFTTPPTISLGADIVLPCGDSIATITYSGTGGGAVQWRIINGPTNWYYPVIPSPWADATTSPHLVYHLSKVGTYTIEFRKSPGTGAACTTATDEVNVTTSQLPQSSNSGTPQLLGCNVT